MVKRRRSVPALIIATVLACLAVVGVPAAFADPGGGWKAPPPPPSGPSQQQPSQSSSSGSSGTPVSRSTNSCSLYANPASFGVACYQGGGSVHSPTVKEILGGDSPDFCWDTKISDTDVVRLYGYTPDPTDPYYLHSCLTKLILDNSPAAQPNVVLSQNVIQIHTSDEHPCSGDPGKDQPYPPTTVGTCIMTLTGKQQSIADALNTDYGRIPGIILTTHPSTKVRTNEWVAYTDRAKGGMTATAKYQVGGVTMWAQMNRFRIQPYGPNGPVSQTCNGTVQVTDADTPDTKPDACWWRYPASSAGQPGQVYPFRAEADWTVYYDAGDGPQVLGSFQRYTDLQLPVFDIQTIVVGVQ